MKKIKILAFTFLFSVSACVSVHASEYMDIGAIEDIDSTGTAYIDNLSDIYTIQDSHYTLHDVVIMLMDDNDTPNDKTDDIIIDVNKIGGADND
jgi:hypothetical protein